METRYVLTLLLLAFIIAILSPELPHEYSDTPANLTENETLPMPLMSLQDDIPEGVTDKRPGWWKHTGNSYVSYVTGTGLGTLSSTGNPAIDISILINGQDASTSPGPSFITGSELTVSYRVTNCGDFGLVDVRVKDDEFGDVGECDLLHAGENVTFELEETVQKGKFSSVGRVSGLRESSLEVCGDQSPVYYFGKSEYEEIPEFPAFAIPILVILGLALMFERRRM
ncbi:MAG: PEF-CTERM sorting domain-containing protein [Methanolobus sp.]|nr:PEF-CTERM sorting domain-containing protein [Methanolobus sp.]